MQKQLKNSLTLGIVAAVVALGSASAFAADATAKSGERIADMKPGMDVRFMQEADTAEAGFGARAKMHTMDFSEAVANGIISQETADKITAFMQEKAEAGKTKMENFTGMTAEEREALKSEESGEIRKMERVDMFEELVNAGIITQSEADALKENMPKPSFGGEREMGGNPGEKMLSLGGMNTVALVESGIIDSATAENMKSYMTQKAEEMKAEMEAKMEAVKNMTEDERKAFFESNKGMKDAQNPGDIFSELVQEGIITQQQADAIKEAMPAKQVRRPEINMDTQIAEPAAL